jgi:hypothetical protein
VKEFYLHITGYCAAHVHVIFCLPQYIKYSQALAYIEWYSEFQEKLVAGIDIYQISKPPGQPKVAIIQ